MAFVQLPDGTLAHFADDVSPEELRKYVIPDLPDALLDQEPASGDEPAGHMPGRRLDDLDALDLPVPGTPALAPKAANSYDNPIVQGVSGINEGIAYALGFPVDVVNLGMRGIAAGINATTGSDIQLPVDALGGSRTFLDLMAPTIAPESDVPFNQILRRGGQEFGSMLIPGLGVVSKSATPVRTLAREATTATGAGLAAGVAGQAYPDNPYAELVAQILGGTAAHRLTQAGERLPTFSIDPARQEAIEMMAKEGVTLSAGQQTDNDWLRRLESGLGSAHLDAFNQNQLEQFTKAALARAGISAPRATPEVMRKAAADLGAQFDALAAGNMLTFDRQLDQELAALALQPNRAFGRNVDSPIVKEMLDRIAGAVGLDPIGSATSRGAHTAGPLNGIIAGPAFRDLRNELSDVIEGPAGPETRALKAIQAILDDAFERSMIAAGSPDAADWQRVRDEYSNFMILKGAVSAAGEDAAYGLISPTRLSTAADSFSQDPYVPGRGDLPQLAAAGRDTMRPPLKGEPGPRVTAHNMTDGLPGATGAVLGYQVADWPGALAGLYAGRGISDAYGRLLLSDPVIRTLMNRMEAKPSSVAEALVAPAIGGTINFAQPDDPGPALSILEDGAMVRQ